MAAAKAVSKSRKNEKRHKSAARTCKSREHQSAERRSEIRQTIQTGHAEGCDEVKYDRPIGWGMQRDAHVCQRSDKVKYGRPIGRGMQRGTHVCQRSIMQRMRRIISIYYYSRQLEAVVGSNDLFASCHILGSVNAMLRFIHYAAGSLKLAVLVPVHACTQQIILVFVCCMYPL